MLPIDDRIGFPGVSALTSNGALFRADSRSFSGDEGGVLLLGESGGLYATGAAGAANCGPLTELDNRNI